jgi:DNA processing protein
VGTDTETVRTAEWALALSWLRPRPDTRAALLLKPLARARPATELPSALAAALGIPLEGLAARWTEARVRASGAISRGAAAGLTPLPWFHGAYSSWLGEIPDPPIVLWCRGELGALDRPAVAIVGSRRASPAGLIVARRLARGMAEAGLVVVSGLARGIDAAAHAGALEVGGSTVGVLGCGGDTIYPREHRDLADRMLARGAVITEFPPGVPPRPHHFPMRNRIISGLSRAVVVIEAGIRSGSLITARMALEQGRDVFAVPGNVASGHYAGSHALIKDGAPLVETVEDVLGALGIAVPRAIAIGSGNPCEMSKLEEIMAPGETYGVDDLAARTGLETAALLAELSALELAGRIGRVPGAGFVKLDKSAIGEGNG